MCQQAQETLENLCASLQVKKKKWLNQNNEKLNKKKNKYDDFSNSELDV